MSSLSHRKTLDFASPTSQKTLSEVYPVSESFKVVEGFDIYRSDNLIIALVVVESDRERIFACTGGRNGRINGRLTFVV